MEDMTMDDAEQRRYKLACGVFLQAEWEGDFWAMVIAGAALRHIMRVWAWEVGG